jgi:citrate synthase
MDSGLDEARAWWTTAITETAPDVIRMRGYPIEQLMGRVSFAAMIWLMLRGELPAPGEERLFESLLVASVDHGPQAPSIASARMAITCGIGINSAMANGINVLGDVHGGAGQQCMELFQQVKASVDAASPDARESAIEQALAAWRAARGRHLPGFGHRFHRTDPRVTRMEALLAEAAADGTIAGGWMALALEVERAIGKGRRQAPPMNTDGGTAVVLLELGFPAPLGRGVFVLSRAVGILAHAWEQSQLDARLKGPMPPSIAPLYAGVPRRDLPPR